MKASCRDLLVMDYKTCWELQQCLFDALLDRKAAIHTAEKETGVVVKANHQRSYGQSVDEILGEVLGVGPQANVGTILLVEHPPVYTLGKSGHAENLLIDRSALEKLGATFYHIDRGGDITFHGPGQLVCYPILDLERLGIGLRGYIEALEEAVIRTVGAYGITAGRIPGASGVWVTDDGLHTESAKDDAPGTKNIPPRKICAIGVRSSRFITMHGFALNVSTDLRWFSRINPCGFTDRGVTSIERETGQKVAVNEVKALVVKFLDEILNVRIYK